MSLWLASEPLVLASKSQARRTLLEAAGVAVAVRAAELDERALEATATSKAGDAIALLLAREKALSVARLVPGRLVLGADQTLSLGTQVFAKPADREAAREQLRALSGREHELHSALVFARDSRVLLEHVDRARLTMRVLSDRFIDLYLNNVGDAATASVGAYQLEGPGAQLFERIDGDYFTVLGLPLLPALAFLRGLEYLAS